MGSRAVAGTPGNGALRFGVLGALRVERDGREVDPGRPRQRALLAILALEAGHVMGVDRLIVLLWRDEPPGAAIAAVQAYISHLRRLLEPDRAAWAPARVLMTQDPGYVLRVDPGCVDALEFQTLIRDAHDKLAAGQPTAADALLENALALWRGDPLAEFSGQPWATATVERLTQAHDLAVEYRIDAWLALGRHAHAVTELETMVAVSPLVAGTDAEHLLLDLEPAIAAGFVTAAGGGWGFRFRHPLIHESLYASAGQAERARLHARVAAVLEDTSAAVTAGDVAQLAYHYLAAGPFGDPAKAVNYSREAAGHATRQGAWQDAARHLEQALAAISPALADAEAARCDVLVELGQARRSGGMIREAHSAFGESISLADRTGDEDRMLAAAVAFGAPQLWGPREWGETDTGLIALLERQLNRVGDGDPARRVRIMATLATELYFDEAAVRGWDYANEALDAARRLGQPEELGIAVCAYLWSAEVTDNLSQIRTVLGEMLTGRRPDLTPQVQAILLARQLTERIRSGELARFDAEFAQAWRLADDVLHSPELQIQLRMVQACRYFVAGDVERGAGLIEPASQSLLNLGTTWREPGQFVLGSCQMLVAGTLADHAGQIAARIAHPDHPSIPHLAAPAAALGFAQRGDTEQAHQITTRWFAPPPRSWTWFQAMAYWAQVATALGIPDPAWLYAQLAPHTGELAIVGHVGDCGGAVDSLLAGLAWRLGRPDEAIKRAQAALSLETRVGSQIWINRTKDLIARITAAP